MEYKDLTPMVPELGKLLPFFLPKKVKRSIADAIFFALTL